MRVQFHEARSSAQLLCGNYCGPGTAEGVKNYTPPPMVLFCIWNPNSFTGFMVG